MNGRRAACCGAFLAPAGALSGAIVDNAVSSLLRLHNAGNRAGPPNVKPMVFRKLQGLRFHELRIYPSNLPVSLPSTLVWIVRQEQMLCLRVCPKWNVGWFLRRCPQSASHGRAARVDRNDLITHTQLVINSV